MNFAPFLKDVGQEGVEDEEKSEDHIPRSSGFALGLTTGQSALASVPGSLLDSCSVGKR